MKIAITGHTTGLGKSFYDELIRRGHHVEGFSRTNGYDLRVYSRVSAMLDKIVDFNVFINNAKPDYAQSQILYRLTQLWNNGMIISIGSMAIINDPQWTDSNLLEYLTQKTALAHAHSMISRISQCQLILLNPAHLDNDTLPYVQTELDSLNL